MKYNEVTIPKSRLELINIAISKGSSYHDEILKLLCEILEKLEIHAQR